MTPIQASEKTSSRNVIGENFIQRQRKHYHLMHPKQEVFKESVSALSSILSRLL